ncbi:MAG: S8 family serine peptidase [Leptolyngbyaceae cyanobacterium]
MSDRFPVVAASLITDPTGSTGTLHAEADWDSRDLILPGQPALVDATLNLISAPPIQTKGAEDAAEWLSFKKPTSDVAKIMGQTLAGLSGQAAAAITPQDVDSAHKALQIVAGDYVVVDFVASGSTEALAVDLKRLGAKDPVVFGRMISAKLPIAHLEAASHLESLQFARPSYGPITNAGSVAGQGDAALRTDAARSTFAVDGSGVTVGILSDSFDNLKGEAADIASGDLPANVQVLDELNTGKGKDEGRAMAQLVHDIAPGADIQFHTAFEGQASFAQGILDLVAAGSDVIVDDIFYYTEPMFQDGVIAQAVDQAVAAGVTYFSAAGNKADQSYESVFRGVNDPDLEPSYLWHDFDPGAGVDTRQEFTLANNESIYLSFQWDQPFASAGGPGSASDLDIFILDKNDQTMVAGDDFNVGADAVEVISFTNTTGATATFDLLIGQYTPQGGPTPTLIKYIDFNGGITDAEFFTNSATSFGHTNAEGSLAVGAAYYDYTPEFGQTPAIAESFSALGGIPILFDAAGNRLATPDYRDNVDFVAPDGINNTFFGASDFDNDGLPNFFGTSAAAPQAAAVAALMLELDPTLTPAAIEQALETTALDMATPGYDRLTGAGLIQADAALAAIAPLPPNTAPLLDDAAFAIAENSVDGTVVGTLTATDPEGDALSYRIASTVDTDGDGNAAFRLEGNQLLVNDSDELDYETNPNLIIPIQVGDGEFTDDAIATVTLTDVDETPAVELPTVESSSGIFAEYGNLDLTQDWQTVTLSNDYINPVVIVSDPTFNEGEAAAVRLQNVTGDAFQIRLQEPTVQDDLHAAESVAYIVIESGDWILNDGTRVSAGAYDSNRTRGFDTINLTGFDATPTVLSQVQTFNDSEWVTTRIKGQSSSRFRSTMQEEEALSRSGHASETIGWLAIEQGSAADADTLLQSSSTAQDYNHNRSIVSFAQSFDTTPSLIAKLGSYRGSDTANVRLDTITSTGFGVRVHEEQSKDSEIAHIKESVSFLALEGTAGTLTGLEV